MDLTNGADLAMLELPEGHYLVMAKVQLDASGDLLAGVTVECTLEAGGASDHSAVRLSSLAVATLPLSAPVSLLGPGVALLHCEGSQIQASRVQLTANKVDSLEFQP
jgi:hypothetical protein